ncbi:MAG: DUF2344 domain-containing protein [Candidatus Omnitrophica bacterium]|nr:DUF2344 domain-containing protein [Candidatus Omnitrophota bacterium]
MQITRYSLKATLKKKGEMIYFSQIDLIHLLERALRRSDLPLYFTQGFRPHVKISLLTGLKLGVEGKLDAVFYFSENISAERLKKALGLELPQGLDILNIEKI